MDILGGIINNNKFVNKHGDKIVWGIAILCFLLMLLHIALTLRTQHKIKASNYQPKTVKPIRRNAQQLYRANDIISANLFGDPKPAKVVKVAPKKTTLDLTLQGILWGTDETMGRAIIVSGKKKSKLYSVGDDIDGAGASVKEIKNLEVLLNRNGATESLPLIKKTNNNKKIITYVDKGSSPILDDLDFQDDNLSVSRTSTLKRATPEIRSENNRVRKIRKPNFSGLDRALKKMGEL